jgi:hypothetical protein
MRRDAALEEMRREVRSVCDGVQVVAISTHQRHGILFVMQRHKQNEMKHSRNICVIVLSVLLFNCSMYRRNMMPSADNRRHYPMKSWKRLPLEQAERRVEALGLHFNQPERALICARCKYALKPSGETVSKHL